MDASYIVSRLGIEFVLFWFLKDALEMALNSRLATLDGQCKDRFIHKFLMSLIKHLSLGVFYSDK